MRSDSCKVEKGFLFGREDRIFEIFRTNFYCHLFFCSHDAGAEVTPRRQMLLKVWLRLQLLNLHRRRVDGLNISRHRRNRHRLHGAGGRLWMHRSSRLRRRTMLLCVSSMYLPDDLAGLLIGCRRSVHRLTLTRGGDGGHTGKTGTQTGPSRERHRPIQLTYSGRRSWNANIQLRMAE